MELSSGARDRIASKFRDTHNIDREIVDQIAADVLDAVGEAPAAPPPSPFAVSWMDSYLAHWELRDRLTPTGQEADDVERVVRELVDVRFNERLGEISDFLRNRAVLEPPDGGPPEPGTPPTGPSSVFEAPDGGPPEPGTPPTGPDVGLVENPWILYWFVSVKAPMLLDVMDAHLTRRLNDLAAELR
jgi:hypothetical protein